MNFTQLGCALALLKQLQPQVAFTMPPVLHAIHMGRSPIHAQALCKIAVLCLTLHTQHASSSSQTLIVGMPTSLRS